MTLIAGGGSIGGHNTMQLGLQSAWNLSKRWSIFAEGTMFFADRHGKLYEFKDSYTRFLDLSVGLTYNLGKTGFKKTPDVDAIMALNAA